MHLDAVASAVPDMPAAAQNRSAKPVDLPTCATDIRTISYLAAPALLDEVACYRRWTGMYRDLTSASGVKVTKEITEPAQPFPWS